MSKCRHEKGEWKNFKSYLAYSGQSPQKEVALRSSQGLAPFGHVAPSLPDFNPCFCFGSGLAALLHSNFSKGKHSVHPFSTSGPQHGLYGLAYFQSFVNVRIRTRELALVRASSER